MPENIFVPIGKCVWEKSPSVLFCKGLGSCVAVAIYDIEKKEGCLIHVLLPHSQENDNPFYYANMAVTEVAVKLKERIERGEIVAKITGGANIFSVKNKSVGERNIESVRYWLEYYNIPVVGEDVGGNEGRNVVFNLSNGEIYITTIKRGTYKI